MGKVSKEKVSKKSVKRSSEAAEEAPHVIYDDDDDEEEEKEANISSEEEEEEENERRRHKLLEAISALGGRRKRPLGERSEAAVQMSEFTVSAEGGGGGGGEGGVQLSDLIGSLDQNPEVPNKTKKQLKNLQHGRTVESPLSRQQSERIQRDVAFQKAAAEVTRWKSLIQQNQRAEQLVFPLQREASGPRAMERVVTGWKAHTPLEQEVFALLSANQQPIHDPILTPAEEASLRAMSLEDAKIRRAELQKARALQSYYEAKARRERKIKSKKYHKVQNKSKRKEFLKKFDDMVKTDPAAALQELNRIELARMQERMSLKHQNSGKWAKSKAIMAKYDESARKAMQQQLEVNKELTQKLVTPLSNEQEEAEEEEEEAEVLPEFVNDAERGLNSSNPWMRGKLSEEPAETEKNDAAELTAAGVQEQQQQQQEEEEEEEEEEVVETEEEALLRQFDSRRKQRQAQEAAAADDDEDEDEVEERKKEEEELSEFTSLYREMADTEAQQTEEEEEGIRTEEDVELLGQEESAADEAPAEPPTAQSPPPGAQKAGKNRKRKRGIELKKVLTKEARVIQVPLAPTVEDSEEESEEKLDQRGLIKEAFAGDDVVSDFLKEKRQQEGAGKPKVVDLTLPGWGEWGGTGLKPSRTKRRRFRTKMAPPPPRKDQKLPSVIISEARNSSISLHQVNSLPGPFQNHAQFEGTIRCPLGRTWNTERTVKKITKPRVVTQLGAIIEPMAREELMKGSKSGADRKRKH
ncbi:hypothetical protein PAMA_003618 [Pampus argenteus]